MSQTVLDQTDAPDPKAAKAQAKAAKAHAKAMRPWFKKKRFLVLIAIGLLVAITAASGGGDDKKSSLEPAASSATKSDSAPTDPTDTERQGLYPDRADVQSSDHEAELGRSVRISGYTATVTGAEMYTPEFGSPSLVVHMTIENRDDQAQPYNLFDWRVQNAAGQVLDPTINLRDDDLGSGDLVQGGSVTGTVSFDVPAGTYYVIYKPDMFDDARGVWQVTAN